MKKCILFLVLFINLNALAQKDTEIVFSSLDTALMTPLLIKSLDLSEQNLDTLSSDVLKLINLEKIDLGGNPKLDLNQAFHILKGIKNLKILWLTEGKLKSVSDSIGLLVNLEEIWLDDNELFVFPEAIKHLNKLKYLRLFSNKINNLSFKGDELQNLIYIDLCYNGFETFPLNLQI